MNSTIKRKIAPVIMTVFMVSYSGLGMAAGDLPDTFVLMPIRTIAVKGDASKFRALNWMNDGTTGGIKEMTVERNLGKGTSVSFEGHAIPGDNDLGADLTLTRDNVGYMKLEYGNFRKWYDNAGGFYIPYKSLSVNRLENSDLHLDIGHFLMEFGSGSLGDPSLSLTYERDTKTGIKSRLSWAGVYDQATSASTSDAVKIAPSWQKMDQSTDTLTLRGKAEALGFTLKGQGSYEFFNASSSREFKALSTNNTGTTGNIARTYSQPQTKLITTNVRAERWSMNDKTYVSTGYRFAHNNNSEIFTLRTYTYLNALTGGSRLYKNGWARSFEDTHTWTGALMSGLTEDLNFTAKGKAEIVSRHSSGDYFSNTSNPPTETSWNFANAAIAENKILRTGESASLRYNGVPKTSLYAEMDLEQERNWVAESESNPQASSNTAVNREEIARNSTLIETLGARFVPTRTVNMTTQYKHSFMGQTFNTLYKIPAVALNYNSIFNKMNTDTDEVASKVSWKPVKWLENSLKYKVADHVYHTNAQTEDWVKTQMNERDYIYDLTLMPVDTVMFNLSYSRQDLKASTPQSQVEDAGAYDDLVGIPVFTANVYTWMFSTSYAPRDNFSIFNTVEFSRAKNANNPSTVANSVRYGVDDQWWQMTYGLRWSPKKDLTIEPHYAYYSFRANESIETGNYSAHAMWLDLKYNW